MSYKLLEIDEYSLEAIDEQIKLGLEEMDNVIDSYKSEFDEVVVSISTEGIIMAVGMGLLMVAVRKLLKRLFDVLKKVLRWIGKKLGFIKDRADKIKSQIEAVYKASDDVIFTHGLDDILTDDELVELNNKFFTLNVIWGDVTPQKLSKVYTDYYNEIKYVSNSIKKMTKDHTHLLHDHITEPYMVHVDTLNKYTPAKLPRSLSNRNNVVQSEYGKLDNNNVSIISEISTDGKYNNFIYKTTMLSDVKDFGDVLGYFKVKEFLEKPINTKSEDNDIDKLIKNMETTLSSKIDNATDEEYLKFLRNVVETIPRYCTDKYLSSINMKDNILTFYEYTLKGLERKQKGQ